MLTRDAGYPAADWYLYSSTLHQRKMRGNQPLHWQSMRIPRLSPSIKGNSGIPEGCDGNPGCVENPAARNRKVPAPVALVEAGRLITLPLGIAEEGKLPEGYQPVCATGTEKGSPAKNLAKDWAEHFALQRDFFEKLMG